MSHLLARVARALTHHWKRGLFAALVSVVLLGAAAGTAGTAADDFSVPGTESQEALDLFREHSPALAGAEATLVYSEEGGRVDRGASRGAVEDALGEVRRLEGVASVSDPFGEGSLSEAGDIAVAEVRYRTEPMELEKSDGEALEEAARAAEAGAGEVSVAMRGVVVDIAEEQSVPVGELIGVALAIVLLTLLFRSAAAMGATLAGALIGVMVGQMLLAALSQPLGLPEFAATIAVMLGLGAGIDYSLLILGRFREQVAAGDTVRDASAKAAATAGASVVAAGLIVMVAIAGLLVVGIPIIGKMGIGAAIGIAAVVVSALTFLPVMIGALARWLRPKRAAHAAESPVFRRWGEIVTARPWVSVATGVAVLLLFAAPVMEMRLGQPVDGNKARDATQRVAYDKLSEAFGPGANGPFLIAVDIPKGNAGNAARLAELEDAIGATEGVASVSPAAVSEDGEMATITAIPDSAPQDQATSNLLEELRGEVIPGAVAGEPIEVYVGGVTATFEDFSARVADRLPLFIAMVIGLSVLLLMAAFRSLWVPLVSAAFNLLSVGAAYGVVTAVFQQGVGASLFGSESGVPIVSFVPVMLFAILFGLSMDYNVFLVSRIHEAYNEGDPPRESVMHGMARIGKVVLFAALIMASVFLAFVTQTDVITKMMGLGLGLAILIDVLVVRLVVAPAVVTLLGDRAWWFPRWLDRVLPNVSIEGHLVEGRDGGEAGEAPTEREREPVAS